LIGAGNLYWITPMSRDFARFPDFLIHASLFKSVAKALLFRSRAMTVMSRDYPISFLRVPSCPLWSKVFASPARKPGFRAG
jgi:hypothetical protein